MTSGPNYILLMERWGFWEEPNTDGGPYAGSVTPIFNNYTTAGWVKVAMKVNNPTLFCVVHHCQQADGTAGAQMHMRGGRSYHALDNILPPPTEHMIDNIKKESDDDAEMQCLYAISFPMTKTGYQKFE